MRILIADDHAIVRKGVIGVLHTKFPDAEIREVTNGADVIRHAGREWDIIMLDISMPGEVAWKRLSRSGEWHKRAYADIEHAARRPIRDTCIKSGRFRFLNKELRTEELIDAVLKGVERKEIHFSRNILKN